MIKFIKIAQVKDAELMNVIKTVMSNSKINDIVKIAMRDVFGDDCQVKKIYAIIKEYSNAYFAKGAWEKFINDLSAVLGCADIKIID